MHRTTHPDPESGIFFSLPLPLWFFPALREGFPCPRIVGERARIVKKMADIVKKKAEIVKKRAEIVKKKADIVKKKARMVSKKAGIVKKMAGIVDQTVFVGKRLVSPRFRKKDNR